MKRFVSKSLVGISPQKKKTRDIDSDEDDTETEDETGIMEISVLQNENEMTTEQNQRAGDESLIAAFDEHLELDNDTAVKVQRSVLFDACLGVLPASGSYTQHNRDLRLATAEAAKAKLLDLTGIRPEDLSTGGARELKMAMYHQATMFMDFHSRGESANLEDFGKELLVLTKMKRNVLPAAAEPMDSSSQCSDSSVQHVIAKDKAVLVQSLEKDFSVSVEEKSAKEMKTRLEDLGLPLPVGKKRARDLRTYLKRALWEVHPAVKLIEQMSNETKRWILRKKLQVKKNLVTAELNAAISLHLLKHYQDGPIRGIVSLMDSQSAAGEAVIEQAEYKSSPFAQFRMQLAVSEGQENAASEGASSCGQADNVAKAYLDQDFPFCLWRKDKAYLKKCLDDTNTAYHGQTKQESLVKMVQAQMYLRHPLKPAIDSLCEETLTKAYKYVTADRKRGADLMRNKLRDFFVKQFSHCPVHGLEAVLSTVKDIDLEQCVDGIGYRLANKGQSCYLNALVGGLLHTNTGQNMLQLPGISASSAGSALKQIATRADKDCVKLRDVIRTETGDQAYQANIQHDASETLDKLLQLPGMDVLKQASAVMNVEHRYCYGCKEETCHEETLARHVLYLQAEDTTQDMLDNQFGYDERTCQQCKEVTVQQYQKQPEETSKLLIMSALRPYNEQSKPIIPSTFVYAAGSTYRVKAVACHHWLTHGCGHWTVSLAKADGSWVLVNDDWPLVDQKRQCPKVGHLFFYERIDVPLTAPIYGEQQAGRPGEQELKSKPKSPKKKRREEDMAKRKARLTERKLMAEEDKEMAIHGNIQDLINIHTEGLNRVNEGESNISNLTVDHPIIAAGHDLETAMEEKLSWSQACIVCHGISCTKKHNKKDNGMCGRCAHNEKLIRDGKKTIQPFGADNLMIPSEIPVELSRLNNVEKNAIRQGIPIFQLYHRKGGQTGYKGKIQCLLVRCLY